MRSVVEIMPLDKLITPNLLRYTKKAGTATILAVTFGLFLNYFDVIFLDNIPIPGLTIILWIYLLFNVAVATPLHYIREREKEVSPCPQCGKPLKIESKFYCDKCGELEFKEKTKS